MSDRTEVQEITVTYSEFAAWRSEMEREREGLKHPSRVLADPEGVTRRIAEINALLEAGKGVKRVMERMRSEAQKREARRR